MNEGSGNDYFEKSALARRRFVARMCQWHGNGIGMRMKMTKRINSSLAPLS